MQILRGSWPRLFFVSSHLPVVVIKTAGKISSSHKCKPKHKTKAEKMFKNASITRMRNEKNAVKLNPNTWPHLVDLLLAANTT